MKIITLYSLLFLSLFTACKNNSPIEKVIPVFERVKKETLFKLKQVERKEIKGLNILDFYNEFPNNGETNYYAKAITNLSDRLNCKFGTSSNVPFQIFVNGDLQFTQPKLRELVFHEKAYDMFEFQDSFNLDFKKGENEIILKTQKNNNAKIFLMEITLPEAEKKVRFNKWSFAVSKKNPSNKIEETKLFPDKIVWQDRKKVYQHSIVKPLERVYPREAHNEWTYANGATMLGLMNIYNYNHSENIFNYVKEFCDFTLNVYDTLKNDYYNHNAFRCGNYRMFRKAMLDDSGAPTLPLALIYEKTKDKKYIDIIEEMTNYVAYGQARLKDGTLCRPEPVEMTVWADDLFMSVPLMLRVAKIKNNIHLIDDAILQIKNIHNYLWDVKTKLHKHAWFGDKKKQSAVYWSRANGWIIWAVTDALNNISKNHQKYNDVIKIYKEIIDGLIKYQSSNGMWHQVLNNEKSFQETSATAMFTLAIATGVNKGWLPKRYRNYALKGWSGIVSKISEDGIVKDICRGTGIGYSEEFYMKRKRFPNDPRGLGAIFTCAVEIQKLVQ